MLRLSNAKATGVDQRPKLWPKAEPFLSSASALVKEAFWQKVWQKVSIEYRAYRLGVET